MYNRNMIEPTPIPIETCLAFDDGKKDDEVFNRYHFTLPAEWLTSATNEKIVGIRSIHLAKTVRKVDFKISIRKYKKSDFKEACDAVFSQKKLKTFDYDKPSSEDIETAMTKLKETKAGTITEQEFRIGYWILIEERLRDSNKALRQVLTPLFDEYNKVLTSSQPPLHMNETSILDREVQLDMVYNQDYTSCVFHFHSPRNINPDDAYYVDIKHTAMDSEYMNVMNIKDDGNINKLPSESFHPISRNEDRSSNYTSDLMKYSRCHEFKHLWDRRSCKVFSSLASQSNRNYLGHTDIHYNPLKYFIIKNTDSKFYVDFYDGRHPKIPVKIPEGESFFIELQLMQYKKLLYI